MTKYPSIVSDDLLTEFENPLKDTLFNNAMWTCGVEERLGTIGMLCPEIIEVDGCIFVADFQNQERFDRMQLTRTKYEIERWTNADSVADLFSSGVSVKNDPLLEAFANALQFFWSLRLKTLFPEREFVVELGMYLEGEEGLTITLQEKPTEGESEIQKEQKIL